MKRFLEAISLLVGCYLSLSDLMAADALKLSGRILADGKGVAGVAVTDGAQIVLTDKRGYYSMISDTLTKFVYISIPKGYEIAMKDDVPNFYIPVSTAPGSEKRCYNFSLKTMSADCSKHVLVVWADPQVYFDEEIQEVMQAASDVRELLMRRYPGVPAVGVCCGDIVGNVNRTPSLFAPMNKAIAATGIPFFFVKGNHDMNTNCRSHEASTAVFNELYGPSYYSFDYGDIHYIVLDDVFNIGKGGNYIGYLDERQLRWLEADLGRIEYGRSIVVCLHIPTWSREARRQEWSKESLNKVLNNRKALYNLLKPYDVHIMSGHEHYNENYLLADNLYEHVHAPLSNLFWCAPWACDGTPGGYAVYEMGVKVDNWYYKGIGLSESEQFMLYSRGCLKTDTTAVVANVWNYDRSWKVVWYEDGICKGEMTRYSGYDPNIATYTAEHGSDFKHKYIGAGLTEHMFFAVPSSASSEIRVELTDRNGNIYTKVLPAASLDAGIR